MLDVKSSDELIQAFAEFDSHSIDYDYLRFHIDRYKYLFSIIDPLISNIKTKSKIKLLDVGPAYLTFLLSKNYPELEIHSLGLPHSISKINAVDEHHYIDLNSCLELPTPNVVDYYDLIICAEVIEHLYTPPSSLILYLSKMMKQSGGQVLIQTPNAVALHKRIKMLFGIQPYPMIEESRMGHYRELTLTEMAKEGEILDLRIVFHRSKNYFGNNNNWRHRLFKGLEGLMPPSLRDGQTIIFEK